MNKIAVDCFYSIQKFMGDQPLHPSETDIDCAFKILKVAFQAKAVTHYLCSWHRTV